MFGYVTVCEPELKIKDFRKYRSYYCGLCQTLKEKYGFSGQMTLTYDMTFAILLLTSLYECESRIEQHRCKVHPVKKQAMIENEITQYAADMNVLLAYYHMKDDWADEKKVSGLLGGGLLKKKAEKIAEQYPRQSKAGEDSVALGTDFDGFEAGQNWLRGIEEIECVWDALKKAGMTERQLDKLSYQNVKRVLEEVL